MPQRDKIIHFLGSLYDNEALADDAVAEALLGKLHELTEPWAKVVSDDTSASRIVSALNPNYSEWLASGIPVEEIPLWSLSNLKAHEAGLWVGAGLTILEACAWSEFRGRKLDPQIVAGWEEYSDEVEREDIVGWVMEGVHAVPGIDWFRAGWHDASMSQEVAQWVAAFPEVDPVALLINFENDRSIGAVRKWLRYGIVGIDLEVFANKGYTPSEAAKLLSKGVSADDAPVDERRSTSHAAKVRSRSWAAIWNQCSRRGWRVIDVNRGRNHYLTVRLRHLEESQEIRVVFEGRKFYRAYLYKEVQRGCWALSKNFNYSEVLRYVKSKELR